MTELDEKYEERLKRAFPEHSLSRAKELAKAWRKEGIDLPDTRLGYPREKVEHYTEEEPITKE